MKHFRTILAALALTALVSGARAAEEDPAKIIAELGLRESPAPVRENKIWVKPKKIVVLADTPARTAWFQAVAPGVTVVGAGNPGQALKEIGDADAMVGFCSPQLVDAAKRLKWIQTQNAGVDECLEIPRARSGSVLITNMQRINGPNIAEHTMALMLALSRQIHTYAVHQRDENWDPRAQQRPLDLQGQTLLIAGLGGIGTEIAVRAHAFGMRIIATRNTSREGPPFVSYVGLADELPKLLGEADIVVNVLPLTDDTRGLFNAEMFARMKPSATFINVGRGPTVVTDALVRALAEKKIAGAGVDVTDPEPLPKGHALWRSPNVIITPHVAGSSSLKQERSWLVMRENLRRYVAGEPMLSVVDVARGY